MNPSEIEALFAQTLVGGYDEEEPWQAVDTLRSNGSREIFDRATSYYRKLWIDDGMKKAAYPSA
jgi:hypothetical protein